MELEKTVRLCELFDVYKNLLKGKTVEVMDLYLNYNFTLSEIAEQMKISRQAVFDYVQKAEKKLEDFEKKLLFLNNKQNLKEKLENIISSTSDKKVKSKLLKLYEEV